MSHLVIAQIESAQSVGYQQSPTYQPIEWPVRNGFQHCKVLIFELRCKLGGPWDIATRSLIIPLACARTKFFFSQTPWVGHVRSEKCKCLRTSVALEKQTKITNWKRCNDAVVSQILIENGKMKRYFEPQSRYEFSSAINAFTINLLIG